MYDLLNDLANCLLAARAFCASASGVPAGIRTTATWASVYGDAGECGTNGGGGVGLFFLDMICLYLLFNSGPYLWRPPAVIHDALIFCGDHKFTDVKYVHFDADII